MSMPPADMAVAFMAQAEKNIDLLVSHGLRGEAVVAIAQAQATCAVASALLAIAGQLGRNTPSVAPE